MVKVGKCTLMHKKWTFRVELTKKTSHCKSRDFLRKRRLKRLETKVENFRYFHKKIGGEGNRKEHIYHFVCAEFLFSQYVDVYATKTLCVFMYLSSGIVLPFNFDNKDSK